MYRAGHHWNTPEGNTRHIVGLEVTPEDEAAIRRATGETVEEAIYSAALCAIGLLIEKGHKGLRADQLIAAGDLDVGDADGLLVALKASVEVRKPAESEARRVSP